MPKKIWKFRAGSEYPDEKVRALARDLSVSPLTARLLMSRGLCDHDSAYRFLSFSDALIHDPFLLADMDNAVARINRALADGEKITIYGDYDVDGVTSTALLWEYFTESGVSPDRLSCYIPERGEEGYGVSVTAIDKLAASGTDLVITVDTGVTAVAEIAYAKSLGIDFVVTDHHECPETLPDADAVVDPERHDPDNKYPFCDLAGVGVAFKLVMALEIARLGRDADYLTAICERYADLVAIGTVADVMPLIDENRFFVSMGLKILNERPREAVTVLLEEASRRADGRPGRKSQTVNSSVIGFTLAPRINAAGRMTSASLALELFLTKEKGRTRKIAAELCALNRRRQEEENVIVKQVNDILEERGIPERGVLVIPGEGWNNGVIGIVASRISEKYHLPTIIVSFDGDLGKGSGRSLPGVDLARALNACSDLLVKCGGHELAAGLTVSRENFDAFDRRINEYVCALSDGECALTPELLIECEVEPFELTMPQARELSMLEPYGSGNPVPLLLMRGVRVIEIAELAIKHTKLTVKKGSSAFPLLMFGSKRENLDIIEGDELDIVFEFSLNEYRGYSSVQLICRDFSVCSGVTVDDAEKSDYRKIKSGAAFSRKDGILPSRDDFAAVYRYMKRSAGRYLSGREMLAASDGMSYIKLRIIIDVLIERGLVSVLSGSPDNDIASYALNAVDAKVELESSPIYKKLAGNMTD